MSIDATNVRDLINNPEGRTPYPEDNKLKLGSASDDSQIQDILNRLTALEGASDDYKLKVSNFGYMGNDLRVQLRDNNSSTTLGDVLEITGNFVESASSPYKFKVPVPVSLYINNANIDEVPEFEATASSSILKSDDYGVSSGAWNLQWTKTRTPLVSWSGDDSIYELNERNYDEHNSVMLTATLGASADAPTHKLDAIYFFTNILNEFLDKVVKPSITDADTIIKFSVIDLGGNLMSLTDSVKDSVTKQTVIVNNNSSNFSSYVTQTLGTKLSGALGNYGIHIEWDKKIIEDDKHTYDKLGVIE